MSNERLRMVAEMQDRASGPMRRIREAAASIRETPGMTQARNWMAGFNKEADKFVKGGGGIAEAMSGMGIGGLAAAASIGTLVARFKELGTHTLALKELGREVGLTTDQVNQFNHAANHFGFDPDRMQGALDHFAGLMPEFRRGYGELNNVLARQPDLIKRLRLEDTKTQLQEIFRFLGTIRNPQDRIKFEEGIFGQSVEPLFAEGTDGFEKQLDRYAKTLQPITKEMEDQARALRDAITDFNDTVGNLETKYGPQILGTLKEGALEVKHTFEDVIKVVETLQRWKDNPRQAINDVSNTATDAVTRGPQYNYDHWHGTGDFRPPTDAADGQTRLDAMQRERDALKAQLDADAKKNPGGFPVRHADDFRRLQDLNGAIAALKDNVVKGAFSKEDPGPSWIEQWRKVHPNSAQGFHPTSFSPEAIEKPITHLVGTLKTAAAAVDENGIKPAAFHPAGLATTGNLDPVAAIAAGTREGFLAAYRELAGISGDDASTARPGFTPAAFHPGGGLSGGSVGGGSYDVSGGGTTQADGSLAANQREAYAAAIGEGLSKTAARALVANLSGEGLARDANRVHWDGKHNSGGIAQWDPERAAAIQRQFGKLPWQMGVADQTRAAIWEYRNNPRFARTKRAMEGDDPGQMVQELVTNWEDPANKGRAISQRMGYLRGFDPDGSSGPMVGLKKVGHLASEQCVALANAAVQFRGSVTEWRKGEGADAGTLRPGTPVATFLDRQGREASRYAGGGIGTPGAHLDHAGVFQRYLTDSAGKRIGMTIAEQFAGSHGVHLRNYMFGQGWGEGNGSNYHAVLGPDGRPLGGSSNPMSELGEAAQQLRGAAADQRDAARAATRKPDWFKPEERPDLAEERRKAGLTGPQSVKLDGGVRADIHLHDGQVQRASARTHGAVIASSINLRRGPQRTQSV